MTGETSKSSLGAIALLFLLIASTAAQVHLSGSLSGVLIDTTYIVDSTITVALEDSLTIAAGAVFLFNGHYDFDVHGYLCAVGTVADSIVFASYSGADEWGGFDLYGDASDDCILRYFYITGSRSTGVDCWSNNSTFSHCTITNNSGSMGGGVSLSGGSPTFEYCAISDNISSYYGGGMAVYNSHPLLTHCTFSGNLVNNNSTSAYGGGLYNSGGDPIIEQCLFTENTAGINASGLGGGLYFTYSDPIIRDCEIIGNASGTTGFGDGGGINCLQTDLIMSNCLVQNNTASSFGGGVLLDLNCSLLLDSCVVSGNSALEDGGGLRIFESSATLTRCVISGNSAGIIGGGLRTYNSTVDLNNCTLYGNTTGTSGGAIHTTGIHLVNSIIAQNTGSCGIYFEPGGAYSIDFCDVYNNLPTNFQGQPPVNLGLITGINANGDPCDLYNNIYLNPAFYTTSGDSAFFLTTDSPCMDAGDPQSPLDPDSTIADLGAYCFDQGGQPPLAVTLTPHNPPIQIPANGGNFQFDVTIENVSADPITFDAWTEVVLPNGSTYGPLLLRLDMTLSAGASIVRPNVTQFVPASAPSGSYLYRCKVGDYPNAVISWDEFTFIKLSTGTEDQVIPEWSTLEAEINQPCQAPQKNSVTVSPNPFNPRTTIQYTLSEPGLVELDIYNLQGQRIATHREVQQNPGVQEIHFDGSDLPSGIYLYYFSFDDHTISGKMMLLK